MSVCYDRLVLDPHIHCNQSDVLEIVVSYSIDDNKQELSDGIIKSVKKVIT
jgi:hypothetical protein